MPAKGVRRRKDLIGAAHRQQADAVNRLQPDRDRARGSGYQSRDDEGGVIVGHHDRGLRR